jgi:predicted aldo/keto reductase-like oxidoreductase
MKDKLIVAGGDKVSVFQYNKNLSQTTSCGQCEKDCPLKI